MSGDAARAAILAAVARGGAPADPAAIAREAAALLADPAAVRPAPGAGDLIERFVAQATSPRLGATLERLPTLADVPAAIALYLAGHGLAPELVLPPDPALGGLDWQGFILHRTAAADAPAALGLARWGIAESGSLVFHSSPTEPTLLGFLPLHHIVVVAADRILPYLEDYAAAVAASGEPLPRTASLITGASGTTDIEGSYVRGAHGPRFVHILLLTGVG